MEAQNILLHVAIIILCAGSTWLVEPYVAAYTRHHIAHVRTHQRVTGLLMLLIGIVMGYTFGGCAHQQTHTVKTMSHEILGTRFLALEQPAWHGLGRVFTREDKMTIEAGIAEVSAGIEIVSKPMYSKFAHDGQTYQVKACADDSTPLIGIWRMPTHDDPQPRFFGTATQGWTVRQYADYGTDLAALNDIYPLTTAGMLGKGDRVFVSMTAEPFDVELPGGVKEEIANYFVAELWNRPGKAHRLLHTPVRVVCQNTLSMGADAASIRMNLAHSADVGQAVKLVAEMVKAMQQRTAEVKAIYERMGTTTLDNQDVERMLARVYPFTKKPGKVQMLDRMDSKQVAELIEQGNNAIDAIQRAEDRWKAANARQEQMREVTKALVHKFNQEHPAAANTLWAFYNACTEHADHRVGKSSEDVASSVLFGNRAAEKAKAWHVCKEMLV